MIYLIMLEVDIDERYDCEKCEERNIKDLRNCDGLEEEDYRIAPVRPKVPTLRLNRCPRKLITPETTELWNDVQRVKTFGHLLHSGGIDDQDAVFVEAYEWCEFVVRRVLDDPCYKRWMKDREKKKKNEEEASAVSNLGKAFDMRKKGLL